MVDCSWVASRKTRSRRSRNASLLNLTRAFVRMSVRDVLGSAIRAEAEDLGSGTERVEIVSSCPSSRSHTSNGVLWVKASRVEAFVVSLALRSKSFSVFYEY